MMATYGSISLMIMYEDESVDVRCGDDSRLQLSPCGAEFVLETPRPGAPAAHPVQTAERVRQRTRFAISSYKALLQRALAFRNRYADRPYLPGELIPGELIPADLVQQSFTVDQQGAWPALEGAWRCVAEPGPGGGETAVSSAEGRARLLLSPSGEEFSVEFSCSLSQDPDRSQNQNQNQNQTQTQSPRGRVTGHISHRQSQTAVKHQSTTVTQHHSSSRVPEVWSSPLSLAQRHRALGQTRAPQDPQAPQEPQDPQEPQVGGGGGGGETTAVPERRRRRGGRSRALPEALPLTCPSPHRHRWKLKEKDSLSSGDQSSEQDLPTERLKVMWCQGVVYRIVGGAIPLIEVSPGDGSVIRSNGALVSYFTHHRAGPGPGTGTGTGPGTGPGEVRELTYHLSGLPPDCPGQTYSVSSVVTRASRILGCYNQARHSLKMHTSPSCLTQEASFSEPMPFEQEVHHRPESGHINTAESAQRGPAFVTAELEKIKRFNFLLENSSLPCVQTTPPGPGPVRGPAETQSPRDEGPLTQASVAEALQRTSRAIQDIDALLSARAGLGRGTGLEPG